VLAIPRPATVLITVQTREVKVCAIWSAESRDAEGLPRRDQGSVSYSAAIETAASRDTDSQVAEFTQRVEREAERRGFSQARRQVALPGSGKSSRNSFRKPCKSWIVIIRKST